MTETIEAEYQIGIIMRVSSDSADEVADLGAAMCDTLRAEHGDDFLRIEFGSSLINPIARGKAMLAERAFDTHISARALKFGKSPGDVEEDVVNELTGLGFTEVTASAERWTKDHLPGEDRD